MIRNEISQSWYWERDCYKIKTKIKISFNYQNKIFPWTAVGQGNFLPPLRMTGPLYSGNPGRWKACCLMTVYLLYNEPVKNSSSYSKTFFDSEHGFPNHGKTVQEYGLEDKIAKIYLKIYL